MDIVSEDRSPADKVPTSSGGRIAFLAPPTRMPSPAWIACTNHVSAMIDGSYEVQQDSFGNELAHRDMLQMAALTEAAVQRLPDEPTTTPGGVLPSFRL